jgi:hypothetical protein
VDDATGATGRRTGAGRVVALVVTAGYCVVAARTHPFSTGADALTAAPFAVVGAVMVRTLRRRPAGRMAVTVSWRQVCPWVLGVTAFCLWELVTYFAGFGGDRQEFPTASFLLDLAGRTPAAKAAVFAAWLALGWGLVRR